MYSVYQPWDPLKVCVVGKSYGPEFYSFIQNPRLRSLFERIATETEEDFQYLISVLKSFNIEVIRPNVPEVQVDQYLTSNRRIPGPISMIPRDQMIMVGEKFFVFPYHNISIKASGRDVKVTNWTKRNYDLIKGKDWPEFTPYHNLPTWVQDECKNLLNFHYAAGEDPDEIVNKFSEFNWWAPIIDHVSQAGNQIVHSEKFDILNHIPTNGITRIGKDLYFGTYGDPDIDLLKTLSGQFFPDYRKHFITTGGHIDGCFTPVKPGLIVSIEDITTYKDTFPGWEVVYLKGESWNKVLPFLELKKKNQGRWWIKDYENDNELIDYVNTWLSEWVGYVEESVFDVNILVVDQNNVIVNNYNKLAFDAFKRHGITAHICPIRHRYFWDGGVHCVTLDLNREGNIQDFFPGRSL